ncbi:MAG: YkgJ family cysteine cluster protein [Spirochaetes bacterium]|nr:YkgJ family cysteine cluster protein [Spirochaetota bacterium]
MESCSCEICKSACRNDAGRLIPEDIKKISAFLNITSNELIQKYLVKIYLSKDRKIFAFAPAKKKGKNFICEPGNSVPDFYVKQPGTCIFLNNAGLCEIHKVKPFECGAYMGCRDTFLGKPYKEKTVEEYFVSRWKKYN